MRDSKFARAAAALARPARGPGQCGTRRLRPVTRPGRAWAAAIAASLLVPAALAVTATAGPALASTAPLAITTTTPLTATAGSAFTAKLSATGGTKPYSWSLAGGTVLPTGLTLHAATGQVTGTPVGPAGTVDFTAQVTDSEAVPATVTATESITVTVTPLTVTTTALPAATAGVAYSAKLTAAGGVAPYSWSIPVGSLPAGLTLHAATGVISGTPKAGGNFTFTVQVTDSEATAQQASAPEQVTVGVAGLVVTTASTLPTVKSGVPYSVKLAAAGGITPYQWSLPSGSLPAGLKLSKSSGLISGTTTATGSDVFTVRVTDAEVPAASATENMTLNVVTSMTVPASLPAGQVGQSYDTSLQPAGGLAPYTYAITAGTLPPGLTLQSTGEIFGSPTAAGASTFTVSVTDSENPPVTVTQAESITVTGGVTGGTFPVGTGPDAIASDGTNMWVANGGSNTVTELSPAGATLGTFPVGFDPDAIASDGTNMWVANAGDGTVTELSPAGATLGTFTVGSNPDAIAFDRTNMWVANAGSSTVTELSPAGATLGTFPVSGNPLGIAFDGTNMWVADASDNTVTKLSPAGATLGFFTVSGNPDAIAFDGTNMWVASFDSVTELSPAGATLGTFPVGSDPTAIAFDRTNMWVTNSGDNTVTELPPAG